MSKNLKKIVVILIIVGLLLTGIGSVFGQTSPNQQEQSQLEERLKQIEARILESEKNLTMTQAERERYQHEINTIRRRIDQLNTEIRRARATVRVLAGQIKETEASIEVSLAKIEDLRGKLVETLRAIHREDSKSIVEILLAERNISDHFDNSLGLEILSHESRDLLGEIMVLKVNLEEEKELLDGKRSETEQMARVRALQAEESERIRVAQEALLREAQRREAVQKQEISELERQAAEIRSRIVELIGVPEGELLSFEELLEVAKWAQIQTGIRPAFLLSIIAQESALGRNVGGCHLVNFETSEGVCIRLGGICTYLGRRVPRTMIPSHIPDFLNITKELGRDPKNTPVSCVMLGRDGKPFGFGGAMGPAQFIPRTWVSVRDEVRAIINRPPDPWKIQDSFLASAVYLRRHGGAQGIDRSEMNAAMRYFSGSQWSAWEEGVYGRPVITRANCFQIFFNHNTMTESCRNMINAFVNM